MRFKRFGPALRQSAKEIVIGHGATAAVFRHSQPIGRLRFWADLRGRAEAVHRRSGAVNVIDMAVVSSLLGSISPNFSY
jgi:hypothetical protein